MAANASNHGVPWGVIEGFGKYTKTSDMIWLGAEDAECWGFIRWSAEDTSNFGQACYLWALLRNEKRKPEEVTAKNADDVLCRMSAGTSRIYVSTDRDGQGFSTTYRKACEPIAVDPKTPKYAAIDIILWLTLTDPDFLDQKPGQLTVRILENASDQIDNCWKCLTIIGMSVAMHGYPKDGLQHLRKAVNVVKRDTGSVPYWLTDRVDAVAAGAATGTVESKRNEPQESAPSLVPRGSEQPSFDCLKAKTAAARLICADGELARLDGELGAAFRKRKARIPATDQPKFVAGQLAWIKERNEHCALNGKDTEAIDVLADLKPCVASALRERIDILTRND
jgi:uncharacterized protein YecT (DUF1311 family)